MASYRCESCGHQSGKWMGFCPQCGNPDPLIEIGDRVSKRAKPADRITTGWREVDRVLGGGTVRGSVLLLGGEPGVGKSTLLLQLAGAMAQQDSTVLIASAEESIQQVALRASRLGIDSDLVELTADDDVDAIVAVAQRARPDLLVIDSIQSVGVPEIPSAPGGVAQVRESAARLIRLAKTTGIIVVLVGHVTKDGGLAGPKILEHMVDVVLYLEGDPDRGFRVRLRPGYDDLAV